MQRVPLPIDSLIPEILTSLANCPSLVVQATPGSGKTTRIPPALLQAAWLKGKEILVLEPRRLAAKYSCFRVAEENGWKPGQEVGYQFRFESVVGPKTKLKFLTEGILLRLLLSDPRLANVGAVILDEFHERHIHTDVAISFLRHLQKTHRPDLRLIAMSATLDGGPVAKFLGDAPILNQETPIHPIEISYHPPGNRSLEAAVAAAVSAVEPSVRDILVFLPGMAEILRAETALQPLARQTGRLLLTLHGELAREAQDLALKPSDKKKIILSTNLAETSLTVPGVDCVIDSGLEKRAEHSFWSGIPTLRTKGISRASAIQRSGRAGRLGPGRAIRLYSQPDFDGRAAFQIPEIQRADLLQTVLELKALGIANAMTFEWFEAPKAQAVAAAEALLYLLGATTSEHGPLNPLGKRLSQIPTHPRLARALLEAEKQGATRDTVRLAAYVSEGELETLNALDCLNSRATPHGVSRVEKQLASYVPDSGPARNPDQVAKNFLTGFPDRVASRRTESGKLGKAQLVLCQGGTAQMPETAFSLGSELFVALEITESVWQDNRSRTSARSLLAIEPEWLWDLTPSLLTEKKALVYDQEKARVWNEESLCYGQLTLEVKTAPAEASAEALATLFKATVGIDPNQPYSPDWHDLIRALTPLSDRLAIETALGRAIPFALKKGKALTPSDLVRLLPQVSLPEPSLNALKKLDWPSTLIALLLPEDSYHLDREAPTSLLLPSTRRCEIHYPIDRGPWAESKLQDFFGWKDTPKVLGGTPVTLHLLAPNQRPVQVTQDLASFWKNHYPTIRKELSRKYPRHPWPENPEVPVIYTPKPKFKR